jgi:hypothetical protein
MTKNEYLDPIITKVFEQQNDPELWPEYNDIKETVWQWVRMYQVFYKDEDQLIEDYVRKLIPEWKERKAKDLAAFTLEMESLK